MTTRQHTNGPVWVLGVVVLALVASSTSSADAAGQEPSWTAPTALSRSDTFTSEPEVVIDPSGVTTVVWGARFFQDGEPGDPLGLVVRRKLPGGDWEDEQVLDENGGDGPEDIVVAPDGAVTVGYGQGEPGHESSRPYAVTSDAAGTWAAPVPLSSEGRLENDSLRLAVDADGATTAVWITKLPGKLRLVTAAHRPVGGPWQPATYLTGSGTRPSGALELSAAAGHATVLWTSHPAGDGRRLTRVRARTLHDGVWSPTSTLSPVTPMAKEYAAVSAGRNGTAIAAWPAPRGAHSSPQTGVVTYALGRSDGSWSVPRTVPGSRGPVTSIRLARSGDRVLAVWDTWDTEVSQVFAATRRQGVWREPAGLSWPDEQGHVPEVAGDGEGRFRVAWEYERVGRFDSVFHVQTRHLNLVGAWSDPVRLTSHRVVVDGTRIAIGSSGAAAVVWLRLGRAGGCCRVAHVETVPR